MVTDGARPRGSSDSIGFFEGAVTHHPGLKEASSFHLPCWDSYCVASDTVLAPRAIPPAPVAPGPHGKGAQAVFALLSAICGQFSFCLP